MRLNAIKMNQFHNPKFYCCCSVAKSCPTVCNAMNCRTLGFPSFTVSLSLLKLMSIEPSNHLSLILCHLLLLLPSTLPSITVFSDESALHIRWPKYWSFSISPSNEYWGLISFRVDWFDLLAVQGTLKSLLQHHSWKASLSLLYGPTIISLHDYWKNHSFDYTNLC